MKKKITCVVYEVGNEDDQTWEMWFENFSRRFLIKIEMYYSRID